MYAKYSYLANVTQAQVLADVVAILTGETNKANLSAGCDQANTDISASYEVAGWAVYDAAAGTNAQVLRAPCVGDATQYKYMKINTNTAGQIFTELWESWNSTTHVGTNRATNSDSYSQRYSTTLAGTLYISASAGRCLMYGVSPAGNGALTSGGGCTGIMEFDRGYSWCGVGQGFVPACFFYGENGVPNCSAPRSKDVTGTIQTSGSSGVLVTMGLRLNGTSVALISGGTGPVMASGFAFPVTPLAIFNNGSTTSFCASGFAAAGVYSNPAGYAGTLDETTFDSKTWVCLPVNGSGAGVPKIIVPKG